MISVSDGVGASTITVNLDVQNVDDAPVFPAFPTNQSIVDGNLLSLSIEVKDADGLNGAVLSEITPSWLTVDGSALNSTGYFRDATVILRGTPAVSDEGPNSVSLTITDSTGLSVTASLIVTVEVHNYPPSINGTDFSVQMTEDLAATWSAPLSLRERSGNQFGVPQVERFTSSHSWHRLVCNGDRSFESYLFARRKFLRGQMLSS